jgi:hypothetical protein
MNHEGRPFGSNSRESGTFDLKNEPNAPRCTMQPFVLGYLLLAFSSANEPKLS